LDNERIQGDEDKETEKGKKRRKSSEDKERLKERQERTQADGLKFKVS
jgi:hypothetical protein